MKYPKTQRWRALAISCLLSLTIIQASPQSIGSAHAQAAPIPTPGTGVATYSAFGPFTEWFTHNIPQRMDRLRLGYGTGADRSLSDSSIWASTDARNGRRSALLNLNATGKPDSGGPVAVWITGLGYFGNVDNDGAAPGYTYSLGGFLAGLDYRGRNWLVGIHMGYVGSNSDSSDGFTGFDTDSFAIGVHGSTRWNGGALGQMYLDGTLTFALMNSDATISLGNVNPGGLLSGGFDGLAVGGYLEAGTILNAGGILFQPLVGLRVVHMRNDGFNATGPTATFQFSSMNKTSARSLLGARVSRVFGVGGGRLTLKGRAIWQAELADASVTGRGTQVGGANTLFLRSNSTGRHFAHLGTALHYQFNRSAGILFDYSATLSSRAVVHAIWGAIRIVW